MIATPRALLSELQSLGLVAANAAATTADAPDAPTSSAAHDRPWYIGLLLGASGWLAGLFLPVFVAVVPSLDEPPVAALTGTVLLAAAWGLFKADRDGAFVGQLALALSIAGQCLLLFAMSRHADGIGPLALGALGLQTVLALVMPNRLHRTLSAFFATIAWVLTVRFVLLGQPEFWRGEGEPATPLAQALGGWLLAWLPLGAGIALLIRQEPVWMARGWQPVVRPVLAGLIAGLGFATVVSQPFESFRWFGGNPVEQGWLALWPMLSALAALGGVAAAFALRSRALIGAGAVAALLHVSHFYYALGTGLLLKSVLMLATGGALLLAAHAVGKKESA